VGPSYRTLHTFVGGNASVWRALRGGETTRCLYATLIQHWDGTTWDRCAPHRPSRSAVSFAFNAEWTNRESR
jgi:hypothetical protein